VWWGRRGDRRTLALYSWPYISLLARLRWGRVEVDALIEHRVERLKGAGRSHPPSSV
jgi:hypothetical protein